MKIEELYNIVPWQQLRMIKQSRELRAIFSDMVKAINRIPALRETENNNEARAVFHYFDTCGSADWYVFEANLETGEGFGFVTLSGEITDPCAEFGYINLFELAKTARLNLDMHYFEGITKNQIWLERYGKPVEDAAEEEKESA